MIPAAKSAIGCKTLISPGYGEPKFLLVGLEAKFLKALIRRE